MAKAKHLLRSRIDQMVAFCGLLRWYERRMCGGLTILTYHRVLPWAQCVNYPRPALAMPAWAFRQQMKWLHYHCRVLPVCTALSVLSENDPMSKPLVAVTFDDGYEDNYEIAAPIMEEYGLRGTFYIASGFAATGQPQWYDRAAVAWQYLAKPYADRLLSLLRHAGYAGSDWMEGLKRVVPDMRQEVVALAELLSDQPLEKSRYRPMLPLQIKALHESGHEIGSHTVSHPILPQLPDAELSAELQNSAIQLSRWTGTAISGFCYPNGDCDSRVERAVKLAGYRYACTTREDFNRSGGHPFRLARLPMTMQRTMCSSRFEPLGFRAELCRARNLFRLL